MTVPAPQRREPAAVAAVERDLRAPRAAGIAGLVFAALFTTSLVLLRNHPEKGASAESLEDWYLRQDAGRIALVGLYLAPFAGIAFLWFIAVLRNRFGERGDRFFETVFLGSGFLFVAMLFASSAAAGALLAAAKFQGQPAPSPDAVLLARALAYAFLFVFAVRAAAVFMLVVSTIALRVDALPRWLALSGYPIGLVLLLSVTYFEWVVLLFPAWVAVASIQLLRAERG